MSEEQVEKHVTTIEWETDTEKVKVYIRVERFPKEEATATSSAS